MESNTPKFETSQVLLKNLALIAMIVNHVFMGIMSAIGYQGFWFYLQVWATRFSFVIYAFLISEGMMKTHNRYQYIGRLALFALISEIPFDLCFHQVCFYPTSSNVFFTLMIGAIGIELMDHMDKTWKKAVVAVALMIIGQHTDYGIIGIALIFCFYCFRDKPAVMYSVAAILMLLNSPLGRLGELQDYNYDLAAYVVGLKWYTIRPWMMFLGGILAFPLIALYKGKKGRSVLPAWFYYVIYPAHLLVIYIVECIIMANM